MPKPSDLKLYDKIKSIARKKFKTYPSIYANSWLVREYKKRGGKYTGSRNKSAGLNRWYEEEWIDVCKLPKKVKCGRSKISRNWKKKYPYCRPLKRISKKTPRTVKEITKNELKKRCKNKRKYPNESIYGETKYSRI